MSRLPRVRAVYCDYRSADEEVFQALKRATDPLTDTWDRLSRARRIGIKFNQDWPLHRMKIHEGHRQQLVSDTVARATLRLLRERTAADLFAVDWGVEASYNNVSRVESTHVLPICREFNVPFLDGPDQPVQWVGVPGGGQMFERYPILQCCAEADEIISVQKLKNHAFMGITLCLKNLFGLMPTQPLGRPRPYYHHLTRMPYMLADLGRIYKPALNILDGIVSQAGQEWGDGQYPRIGNTLVAGEQVIATDAVGAALMGHDPRADWLTPPFHRDRNALLVAAEGGFGTVDLSQIDYQTEVTAPVAEFFSMSYDSRETVLSWQRSTAEQALFYRDHQRQFVDQYAGQYILLQMNEVRWADPSGIIRGSRRDLSGAHPEQAMWLKYVDPEEAEGEHFEVYERALQNFPKE